MKLQKSYLIEGDPTPPIRTIQWNCQTVELHAFKLLPKNRHDQPTKEENRCGQQTEGCQPGGNNPGKRRQRLRQIHRNLRKHRLKLVIPDSVLRHCDDLPLHLHQRDDRLVFHDSNSSDSCCCLQS